MAQHVGYPQIAIVLGAQWGDEGKGKLTDILSEHYDLCARYNGGSNAGHTIVKNGHKYATHLLPSGILTDNMTSYIGNGVVIHFPTLLAELEDLKVGGIKSEGRLLISDRAHVVFEFHRLVDGANEDSLGKEKQLGTTLRGIGPSYTQKMERSGIRVHHLFEPDFEEKYRTALRGWQDRYGNLEREIVIGKQGPMKVKYPDFVEQELAYYKEHMALFQSMVVDTSEHFEVALADPKKKLLIESANAVMLDIDHGTYPYVTSSNPTVGGACTGLGIPVGKFGGALVAGIVKAYTTRVGKGPFPTELDIEPNEQKNNPGFIMQDVGRELGTTTKRKRRCGWLDLAIVRYGNRVNGYTCINLTKLDVLDQLEEIKVCTHYTLNGKKLTTCPASLDALGKVECHYTTFPGWKESISHVRTWAQLPKNAQTYVQFIEKELGVPVRWIGTGPDADAMIDLPAGCLGL
jgi:adenylosuccinate synthase